MEHNGAYIKILSFGAKSYIDYNRIQTPLPTISCYVDLYRVSFAGVVLCCIHRIRKKKEKQFDFNNEGQIVFIFSKGTST